MQLPPRFVERIRAQLGEQEAAQLCEALEGEQPTSVRLHPLRGERCALPVAEQIPWCAAGRYLTDRPSFTLDAAFHAGAYYVQEASSQFVGRLMPTACAGLRVLDMCAAPGGKTTLYASMVGATGLVVANEIDRKRVQVLADNVRKWGLGNVAVTCGDAETAARMESWYDVVAVDAPCSGEGMFRKDDEARKEWSEQNVRLCAEHFKESRITAFSTGCVYPLVTPAEGGCGEDVLPDPVGEYSQSCLGRERIFEYYANKNHTRLLLFRLNYAIDLRYGVLHDIAQMVWKGEKVNNSVSHFNVIWQGSANEAALRSLELANDPREILNVTGAEQIATTDIAEAFGRLFGKKVEYLHEKSGDRCYLNNAEKMHKLFGKPAVSLEQMIQWQADWILSGGKSINKPTHFEVNNGKF